MMKMMNWLCNTDDMNVLHKYLLAANSRNIAKNLRYKILASTVIPYEKRMQPLFKNLRHTETAKREQQYGEGRLC